MSSLTDRFKQPLPFWIQEIKEEVRAKISSTTLAAACRRGDVIAIENLIIGLWPFIDAFPVIIKRGCMRICKPGLFYRFGPAKMLSLFLQSYKALTEIEKDEEEHRKLWLRVGESLGLSYPNDYDRPVLPEVEAWIQVVDKDSDPFTMFLRFVAIEMIAESGSKDFLASDNFTSALGKHGCHWFRVHVAHHTGMTHEKLAFHLAFAFYDGEPVKETCNAAIQEVVDLLVGCANACCKFPASQR